MQLGEGVLIVPNSIQLEMQQEVTTRISFYDNLISHIEDLHKLQDCPMAKENINGYIQAPF